MTSIDRTACRNQADAYTAHTPHRDRPGLHIARVNQKASARAILRRRH